MRPEQSCGAVGVLQRIGPDAICASSRRSLLVAIGSLPLALMPSAVRAQKPSKPVVIGWLQVSAIQAAGTARNLAAFKDGLAALGWREGIQYVIEVRSAEGRPERLSELARELAAFRPALLIATSGQTASILEKFAPGTPIVQVVGTNPLENMRAESLARPGGMTTGMTSYTTELGEKLLEFLVAIEPKAKHIGFLVPFSTHAPHKASHGPLEAARRSALRFKVKAEIAHPATPEEVERALKEYAVRGVQALIVMSSPLTNAERPHIMRFAQAQRWPVLAQTAAWPRQGALLSYAADTRANYRRAAHYADRILKGAKPSDLPIEQPSKFELILNLKVAKALGLTVPQSVLVQATQVIE